MHGVDSLIKIGKALLPFFRGPFQQLTRNQKLVILGLAIAVAVPAVALQSEKEVCDIPVEGNANRIARLLGVDEGFIDRVRVVRRFWGRAIPKDFADPVPIGTLPSIAAGALVLDRQMRVRIAIDAQNVSALKGENYIRVNGKPGVLKEKHAADGTVWFEYLPEGGWSFGMVTVAFGFQLVDGQSYERTFTFAVIDECLQRSSDWGVVEAPIRIADCTLFCNVVGRRKEVSAEYRNVHVYAKDYAISCTTRISSIGESPGLTLAVGPLGFTWPNGNPEVVRLTYGRKQELLQVIEERRIPRLAQILRSRGELIIRAQKRETVVDFDVGQRNTQGEFVSVLDQPFRVNTDIYAIDYSDWAGIGVRIVDAKVLVPELLVTELPTTPDPKSIRFYFN